MKLAKSSSVEEAIQLYQQDPNVDFAGTNWIFSIDAIPDDPSFLNGNLWGPHNTGQSWITADADIDALEELDITTGDPRVVLYRLMEDKCSKCIVSLGCIAVSFRNITCTSEI